MRLAGAARRSPLTAAAVDQALLAHLCRCTGWQTIREAALGEERSDDHRDLEAAARRAALEGHVAQQVGPGIALGQGGFADDTAPLDALVAVRAADGSWVVGETLTAARTAAAKVQGRRTTVALTWPFEVPPGEWARTLRTTWVEPGYLETDAAWCEPGGEPVSPLANGGAFGGKEHTEVGEVARRLAGRHGRAVRVLYTREDTVRLGPKRPPMAVGIRPDGSGVALVARTAGIAERMRSVAPGLEIDEREVLGPPTSCAPAGGGLGGSRGAAGVARRSARHRAGAERRRCISNHRR